MNYLPRSLVTVNGPVTLARAYYYCSHCGTSHVPWDQRLGLDTSRLSPAVQPLVALAGTLSPFGQADDVLERLAGLRRSASTCRRVTEAAGAALQAQHRAGPAVPPARRPSWDFTLPERDGPPFPGTVAYLGLDAFVVPTRAAGKAGVDWRMLYVGLLYDPRKEHTVYVSGFDFEEVARPMRPYAVACGLAGAATLVAVTDGGNGIERVLRQAFSEAVVFVLDFFHVAERLHALGGLLHNHDPVAARAWSEEAKRILRERGGEGLAAHLRALPLPAAVAEEFTEALRGMIGYVESNRHRMDYPSYRGRGWDVGSGPSEAGCKVLGWQVLTAFHK